MPSILVVEDDEGAREALSDILTEEGFDVRLAANGREALEQLEGGMRPCVILLDLVMPVMDGWEFRQRQLRQEGLAPIPVVVLTATTGDGPEAVPASDVLRKPVDFDALLARVESHCERRAAAQLTLPN